MDLSDERFHRKVMKEAQKQRMWMLARKAEHRWHNNNIKAAQ